MSAGSHTAKQLRNHDFETHAEQEPKSFLKYL